MRCDLERILFIKSAVKEHCEMDIDSKLSMPMFPVPEGMTCPMYDPMDKDDEDDY